MNLLLALSISWLWFGIAQAQQLPTELPGAYTIYINDPSSLKPKQLTRESIELKSNYEASLILSRPIDYVSSDVLGKIERENLYGYQRSNDLLVRTCIGKYEVDQNKNTLVIDFENCLQTPKLFNRDAQHLMDEDTLGHFNRRYEIQLRPNSIAGLPFHAVQKTDGHLTDGSDNYVGPAKPDHPEVSQFSGTLLKRTN